MFHQPEMRRRYVIIPTGLPPCYGHHHNRSLESGATADASFTEDQVKRLGGTLFLSTPAYGFPVSVIRFVSLEV